MIPDDYWEYDPPPPKSMRLLLGFITFLVILPLLLTLLVVR